MKCLYNILYVQTPDAYMSLNGDNIVILKDNTMLSKPFSLHNLESIVCFGYSGASPQLMHKCMSMNISIIFLNPNGKFQGRVTGSAYGNIYLRREQFRICDDEQVSLSIAKNFIFGKIYNSRSVINRYIRDHALKIDVDKFKNKSDILYNSLTNIRNATSIDNLRGIEGECASNYFAIFDDMILQNKDDFFFKGRNKRPPLDYVNALLSFAYSLVTNMCTSALETVGLDAYAGFMHTDRPGRVSLSLDLVEELRSFMADRFVLTLINKKMVSADDFITKENGAVMLKDTSRNKFLKPWQERKSEVITHPFIKEKIPFGLIPYVQAQLLSRYIRGDLDEYPPFIWK